MAILLTFILSYHAEHSHMLLHEYTSIYHHIVDFIYIFFLDSSPNFCNIINFPQDQWDKHVTWVYMKHCLAHL